MTTTDSPAMLRGPDPERFRTSYYGARWYIDPLPADDNWPATKDKWPSVTTVKKAWSKPFRKKLPTGETVPLDAYWAAEFTVDNLAAVNALAEDKAAAMALICGAGKRTLNDAGERGTGVHAVLETLAAGQDPDTPFLDDAVRPFLKACRDFIADWQPRWVASEIVIINRTLGYGGTADAIIGIDLYGDPWLAVTDWKSRGGQHGCYEEEVAQIGGYSLAEYMIVTDPQTGAIGRVPLPKLNGGLIVSLTVDGYQATPIDLELAQEAFVGMHTSWMEHREGQKRAREARGQPLFASASSAVLAGKRPEAADTPVAGQVSAARVTWIKERVERIKQLGIGDVLGAIWTRHPDIPTFPKGGPTTNHHIDVITEMCDEAEKALEAPFGPSDPTKPYPTSIKKETKTP